MTRLFKAVSSFAILLACTQVYSYQIPYGHLLLEGGVYRSNQGESEFISINGLIGDQYNVTKHHDTNWIFGVGYLMDGYRVNQFGVDFGINAFYLAPTEVKGTITQELLFTNLSYKYTVRHIPVYLFAKGFMNTNYNCLAVTMDLGIGPNFMKTNMQDDISLDGGVTLPDNAFKGTTTTTFSGMVGIGLKFYVMDQLPLEVGYRFFYLGEGHFNARSDEILNNLKTGNITAQALLLTLSV